MPVSNVTVSIYYGFFIHYVPLSARTACPRHRAMLQCDRSRLVQRSRKKKKNLLVRPFAQYRRQNVTVLFAIITFLCHIVMLKYTYK